MESRMFQHTDFHRTSLQEGKTTHRENRQRVTKYLPTHEIPSQTRERSPENHEKSGKPNVLEWHPVLDSDKQASSP